MSVKATIKIGSMNLELEAENMKSVFKWAGVYGNLPKACHACQSSNLFLSFRSPASYEYYSLKCAECGAEGNFGQAKEGGGLFWKYDTVMKVFGGGEKKNPDQQQDDVDEF